MMTMNQLEIPRSTEGTAGTARCLPIIYPGTRARFDTKVGKEHGTQMIPVP
jgi:hypothetical protein